MANPYTFGFLDQLVRINFPQDEDDFLCGAFAGANVVAAGRSFDGVTWTENAKPDDFIIFSAAYGNNVWLLGSNADLFRSTDGANTWSAVSRDSVTAAPIKFLAYIRPDTSKPGIFLASTNYSLFRSTDLGVTWTTLWSQEDFPPAGPPQFGNLPIVALTSANNKFFVSVDGDADNGGNPRAATYNSTDGLTWSGPNIILSSTPIIYSGIPSAPNSQLGGPVAYDVKSKKYVVLGGVSDFAGITGFPVEPGFTSPFRTVLGMSSSSDGASWGSDTYFGGNGGISFNRPAIAAGNGFIIIAPQYGLNPTSNSYYTSPSFWVTVSSLDGGSWSVERIPEGGIDPGTGAFIPNFGCGIGYSRNLKLFALAAGVPTAFGPVMTTRVWSCTGPGQQIIQQTQSFLDTELTQQITMLAVGKLKKVT